MSADHNYIYYLLVERLGFGDEYLDHLELWRLLLRREFVWVNPMDRNRAIDGLELRADYLKRHSEKELGMYMDDPCTVLEMLIALSIRIEFDLMSEPGEEAPMRWFNLMINNLDLNKFSDDRLYSGWKAEADFILDRWMKKNYYSCGEGSAFPLEKYKKDQRKMEIWSQMCEYLNENF